MKNLSDLVRVATALVALAQCGSGVVLAADPVRGLVVTIVEEEGFLTGTLAAAGNVDMPEIEVAHVGRIGRRLAEHPGRYDFVMAHAHAPPMRALERAGVVGERTTVFANARSLIGPAHDPAGLAHADSARDAARRIAAAGRCLVIPAHSGAVNAPAWAAAAPRCPAPAPPEQGAAAVAVARAADGYTIWGLHPFARAGMHGMVAFTPPDSALLRPLGIWTVTGSPRKAEVAALIRQLGSAGAAEFIDAFRLRGAPDVRAFWSAQALAKMGLTNVEQSAVRSNAGAGATRARP